MTRKENTSEETRFNLVDRSCQSLHDALHEGKDKQLRVADFWQVAECPQRVKKNLHGEQRIEREKGEVGGRR